MTALKKSFAGAVMPLDLFEKLRDERTRNEIRKLLVCHYLSDGSDRGVDFKSLALLIATVFLVA